MHLACFLGYSCAWFNSDLVETHEDLYSNPSTFAL